MLGLFGRYQMLGRTISDPDGVEGPAGSVAGLGHLDIETVLTGEKITRPVTARDIASGENVEGYEIHLGRTEGPDCARPMLTVNQRPDGAASRDGRVQGSYVHGLFTQDAFRRSYLARFDVASTLAYDVGIEEALDALAAHLEEHLDIDAIIAIARSRVT
jgi:adenosylcobyric acid synthase